MDENQINPKVVQPTTPALPVQPDVTQPIQPTAQVTNVTNSTVNNPIPGSTDINVRSHLWYAVGVVFAIGLLGQIPILGSIIVLVAFIYSIVLSVRIVDELKVSINEASSKKIATALGLGLIITQAIMYYRLRKHNLEIAKAINSFGWIILGIAILINIALTMLVSAFIITSQA